MRIAIAARDQGATRRRLRETERVETGTKHQKGGAVVRGNASGDGVITAEEIGIGTGSGSTEAAATTGIAGITTTTSGQAAPMPMKGKGTRDGGIEIGVDRRCQRTCRARFAVFTRNPV